MPAVKLFPRHTNPQALLAGLVLQGGSTIRTSEFGLKECTFQFITALENYPKLEPKRGTPVDQFRCGDDLSKRVLKKLNFLGAQSSELQRMSRTGKAAFSVLCQGADFDIFDGVYPEYDPLDISGGSLSGDGSTPNDLVSPPQSQELNTTKVTFRFRKDPDITDRVIAIGTARDQGDIVHYVSLGAGDVNYTLTATIPIDGTGRTIYMRDIIESPKIIGGSRQEYYEFSTSVKPAPPPPPDSGTGSNDELAGQNFGPITTPYFVPDSTQQTVTIPILKFKSAAISYTPPGASEPVNIAASNYEIDAVVDYHAIDLSYEYVARDFSRRPRFLQSSYEWDQNGDIIEVRDGPTGSTRKMQLLIDEVRITKQGSINLINPDFVLLDLLQNPINHWREKVVLVGSGAEFAQQPAGQFYHVKETTRIQLLPAIA